MGGIGVCVFIFRDSGRVYASVNGREYCVRARESSVAVRGIGVCPWEACVWEGSVRSGKGVCVGENVVCVRGRDRGGCVGGIGVVAWEG